MSRFVEIEISDADENILERRAGVHGVSLAVYCSEIVFVEARRARLHLVEGVLPPDVTGLEAFEAPTCIARRAPRRASLLSHVTRAPLLFSLVAVYLLAASGSGAAIHGAGAGRISAPMAALEGALWPVLVGASIANVALDL